MKKHFVLKLVPRRPSYAMDMTAAEREVLQQHIVYWNGFMEKGLVLLFGPVMDPVVLMDWALYW